MWSSSVIKASRTRISIGVHLPDIFSQCCPLIGWPLVFFSCHFRKSSFLLANMNISLKNSKWQAGHVQGRCLLKSASVAATKHHEKVIISSKDSRNCTEEMRYYDYYIILGLSISADIYKNNSKYQSICSQAIHWAKTVWFGLGPYLSSSYD